MRGRTSEARSKRVDSRVQRSKTYTTGEISDILDCAARTVSKYIDSGDMIGYRLPHSEDRRVSHENLIEWMNRHGIPVPVEIGQPTVLLAGLAYPELAARIDARGMRAVCAMDPFECGRLAQKHLPVVAILDLTALGRSQAQMMGQMLKDQGCACAALAVMEDMTAEEFTKDGYAKVFASKEPSETIADGVVEMVFSKRRR